MLLRLLLLILLVVGGTFLLMESVSAQAGDAPEGDGPDLTSGTWHLGLTGLFGEDKNGPSSLDIYPVIEDGRLVSALATARTFNTSIHLLESSDVVVDPDARTVRGEMQLLLTPDLWVPKDGQPFSVAVTLDGTITVREDAERGRVGEIGGTYRARRVDGKPLHGDVVEVEGKLYGGVGTSETGWDNAVWSAGLTPVVPEGAVDRDAVIISLGIADGRVRWGTIGLAAQAKWPSHKAIPFDVSGFDEVTPSATVSGTVALTARHLHPGGDPDEKVELQIQARRVQGLIGMSAMIRPADESQDAVWAYGRGSAFRGNGTSLDPDRVLWRHDLDTRPWFKPVDDHRPVAPGEHPRLLFRKSDLPALRAKAETPVGQAILKRLRMILGEDGEAMTEVFNHTPPHNHNKSPKNQPLGTFTTWHAAGFGFLYQITGEQKYADLSRRAVELMLEGKYDIDNRYSWIKPGTDLRSGSVLGAMAYAYDFSYDGWPEDFRRRVAREIQDFNKVTASAEESWEKDKAAGNEVGDEPKRTDIMTLAGRSGYPPGSNHYGSLIGGTGVALLAIQGDPGVNDEWVAARLAEIESNLPRMLTMGFGDGGYYSEGFPPSRLSAEGGLLELLQALRTAAGRDYIDVDRPNADAISTRWVYHVGGTGEGSIPSRGTYGEDTLGQDGLRGSFALGWGAVKPEHRRPLLWTFMNFYPASQPDRVEAWDSLDRPHMAVYAFLNFPAQGPQDPDEVLPHLLVDRIHGYIVARNRWQDKDDIIVTHLMEYGPKGYYEAKDGPASGRAGKLRVFGLSKRDAFDVGATGLPTHFIPGRDGSFTLTAGNALAVDLSRTSGADLVVVTAGYQPKAKKKDAKPDKDNDGPTTWHTLKHDGKDVPIQVYTLQRDNPPRIEIEGSSVHVGDQTFEYDGQNLTLKTFTPQTDD